MPLLFALAGLVALALAGLVFIVPIVLVVSVVRAVRARRSSDQNGRHGRLELEPEDRGDGSTDSTFLELVSAQWPEEGAALLAQHITRGRD